MVTSHRGNIHEIVNYREWGKICHRHHIYEVFPGHKQKRKKIKNSTNKADTDKISSPTLECVNRW